MQAYVDAFHNVRVGIRKPYAVAANNNWGLYNDIFGVTSDGGTPTFLEWAASGNTDMPGSTPEDIAASAMPDWWKLNYSGGEFANGEFRTNALNENICAVLGQIRDSHTTWLGPCSACDFKVGNPEYEAFRYNIETLFSNMGYNYGIYSIAKPEILIVGQSNALDIVWNNSGVAPIYYNCPVTLLLKDNAGNTVFEQVQEFDTTTWLPGRSSVKAELNLPADIPAGEYTLAVKMTTADSRADVIYLAMEGACADGSYDIYSISVGDEVTEVADNSETSASDAKEDEKQTQVTEAPQSESNTGNTTDTSTEKTEPAKEQSKGFIGWIIGGSVVVVAAAAAGLVIALRKKRG